MTSSLTVISDPPYYSILYLIISTVNTESYSNTFYWSISREGVVKEGNDLKDGSIFLENSTCCQPFVINQSV